MDSNQDIEKLKKISIKHLLFIICLSEYSQQTDLVLLSHFTSLKTNVYLYDVITNHQLMLDWAFRDEKFAKTFGERTLRKFLEQNPEKEHSENRETMMQLINFIDGNQHAELALIELMCKDYNDNLVLVIIDNLFDYFQYDFSFDASEHNSWHNFAKKFSKKLPQIISNVLTGDFNEIIDSGDLNLDSLKIKEEKLEKLINLYCKIRISEEFDKIPREIDSKLTYQLCEFWSINFSRQTNKAIFLSIKISIEISVKEKNMEIPRILIDSAKFCQILKYHMELLEVENENLEFYEIIAFIYSNLLKCKVLYEVKDTRNCMSEMEGKLTSYFCNWISSQSTIIQQSAYMIFNYSFAPEMYAHNNNLVRYLVIQTENLLCKNQAFFNEEINFCFSKLSKDLQLKNYHLYKHIFTQSWFRIVVEANLQFNGNSILEVTNEFIDFIILIIQQLIVNKSLVPVIILILEQINDYFDKRLTEEDNSAVSFEKEEKLYELAESILESNYHFFVKEKIIENILNLLSTRKGKISQCNRMEVDI